MDFCINGMNVGKNHRPYVIAEAGVHHYDSLEMAKEYVRGARAAGVAAIKFQTYTAKELVANWAPVYWDTPEKTQFEVFNKKRGFSRDQYADLIAYCNEVGITFLSTPFDQGSSAMLHELGVSAFKIASADLTNVPMIKQIAEYKKPMLLSTGASTYDEIEQMLKVLAPINPQISLLHCSLSYPTPLKEANLMRIKELAERFPDTVIGYSDHTQPAHSETPCALAVALGARVIEKHYTLNTYLDGDDHYHSLDTEGLKRLEKNCKEAYFMCSAAREITDIEMAARERARRSIVAGRDLPAGHVLSFEDFAYKRPGTGISPGEAQKLVGKKTTSAIAYDALIKWEDVA